MSKMVQQSFDWLPPYSLRRSTRAKYIRLTIHPAKGLEVVLPRWASEKDAIQFLEQKRDWVDSHSDLLRPDNIAYEASKFDWPDVLSLAALNEHYAIRHQQDAGKKPRLLLEDHTLIFSGVFSDFKPCVPLVVSWVKQKAKAVLPAQLRLIAAELGFPVNRITIRAQKTLWGSCSHNANISLNAKLLFLSPEMVRYVMVHELCHTQHLNHSKQFWALVERFLPNYKTIEKALRHADKTHVPRWFYV